MDLIDYTKYSNEQLKYILSHIDKHKAPENYERLMQEISKRETLGKWDFNEVEKKSTLFKDSNITKDPTAPKLYSRISIRMFTIIFSTIVGGILMSLNFFHLKKIKELYFVLMFSIVYTTLIIIIVNNVSIKGNIAFFLNLGGAGILEEYFWKKRIGKELKYRKRSIIVPLIITILICIPIFLSLIYYGPY